VIDGLAGETGGRLVLPRGARRKPASRYRRTSCRRASAGGPPAGGPRSSQSSARSRASQLPSGHLALTREFEALSTPEARARYSTHFFLVRRYEILEVGGVDEMLGDALGIDDYDLVWVLPEHSASAGIVERFCYNHRDRDHERLTLRPPASRPRSRRGRSTSTACRGGVLAVARLVGEMVRRRCVVKAALERERSTPPGSAP